MMKRIGAKRALALLLCAALCLSGGSAAWAEELTPAEPAPTRFSARVEGGENRIEVTIEGAAQLDVRVGVLDAQSKEHPELYAKTLTGNGKAVFEDVPAGTYWVRAAYAKKAEGIDPVTVQDVAVTAPQAAPQVEPQAEPQVEPQTMDLPQIDPQPNDLPQIDPQSNDLSQIDSQSGEGGGPNANAWNPVKIDACEAGADYVAVTVTADAMPVTVTLSGEGGAQPQTLQQGSGTVTFSSLAAGVYAVTADYSIPVIGLSPASSGPLTIAGSEPQNTQQGEPQNQSEQQSAPQSDAGTPPNRVVIEETTATEDSVTVRVTADNREVTVSISGASAAKPQTLPQGSGSVTFTGLAAGDYAVTANYTIPDIRVEAATASVTVGTPKEPAAPAQFAAQVKCGAGVVNVVVSGGNRPIVVKLTKDGADAGSRTLESGEGVASFGDLDAGDYVVTVDYETPVEGIEAHAEPVTVIEKQPDTEADPPQFTVDAVGGAGFVTVKVSGHTKPVTVTLSTSVTIAAPIALSDGAMPIAQQIDAGESETTFTGLSAGNYTVTVDYAEPVGSVNAVTKTVSVTEAEDPKDKAITASATAQAGSISVTVKAAAQAVGVALLKDGKEIVAQQIPEGSGTVSFSMLEAGTYTVRVDYLVPVTGVDAVVIENVVVPEAQPTALPIVLTATGGADSVTATVTSASLLPIDVTLLLGEAAQGKKTIAGGVGSVVFEGVPAGTYSVLAEYSPAQSGVSATAVGQIVVTGKPAAIVIAKVEGGENQLTVTGTAQPNSDVTFTTEPASATLIAHVDANGNYSVTITAAAGTYTAVNAQYVGDASSKVTSKGSYVVTAPPVAPDLTVDPITPESLTVLAKTTPGTMVNLGTSDYGQTLIADSRGILRYSLPHNYGKGTVVTFTIFYGKDNKQTAQKTVTVQGAPSYELLKRGKKSERVYRLTKRLAELGYPVSATYSYTDSVVAAVRLFQAANGLSVDGMAGQLTQTALYSVGAIGYGEGTIYPTLVRGDRGMALIYTLQQRLKDLGYYTIRVDGIFGSGTQRAVREFQRRNGLTVTGKADNATQQLLYSSAAKAADTSGGGVYGTLTRSGRYQSAVVPMQRRLKELGYYAGSVDGYFGSQTYRAVRNFQSRNGISVTGKADPYTQQVLYSADARAASGSSSSSGTGYRLLYWGCKGDAVKKLQQALLDKGYSVVRTADGIFGKWTYDGVRAYQKDHGLAVDGIAGKDTQNSLYGTNY